ncbi:hypothetical protein [Echinimonas agarilytica]|uniref:Uncharacterized protein n=1 Tax=Echinimonas agarilytica TaxID=1215918 RepID=A0AA41W9R6_9GAMM|nr:hypothetical protein [Echinimonas agarilytica]MCM2680953.1 hypothetical protein [Echinimonas agarilytica]
MQLLANELSFDGEFESFESYLESLNGLMKMRLEAKKHGFDVHCTKAILNTDITRDINFQQSLQRLTKEQCHALVQWITQSGPFWDDDKSHSSEEYYELEGGNVVTDTCLAEAAFHNVDRTPSSVISLSQPHWSSASLPVIWHKDNGNLRVEVINQTRLDVLLERLVDEPKPITSWEQLEVRCKERCPSLTFSDTSFAGLKGVPFVFGASSRIWDLMIVLETMKNSFNEAGERNEEGHRIYQEHFTGNKAWFSDSSDTEKREFSEELTFKHPENEGKTIFCTWHGKVKTPQMRIHHSWPISKDTPLYVTYVGPKITKR